MFDVNAIANPGGLADSVSALEMLMRADRELLFDGPSDDRRARLPDIKDPMPPIQARLISQLFASLGIESESPLTGNPFA